MSNGDVSRDEFNEVRDTVTDLGHTVAQLVEASKGYDAALTKIDSTLATVSDKLNVIATNQSETKGQRGTILVSNVWHALGAFAVASGIVGTLIMFAIEARHGSTDTEMSQLSAVLDKVVKQQDHHHADGHPDRVERKVDGVSERLQRHEDIEGHPEMTVRLSALERTVQSNRLENEAQHRWLADVMRLSDDWQYRTRNLEVPPPSYQPLQGIGEPRE